MSKVYQLKKFILVILSICIIYASLPSLFATENLKQENRDLIETIIELVREEYIDETNEDEIIESAINGMLQSLDPHSIYLNPKNYFSSPSLKFLQS